MVEAHLTEQLHLIPEVCCSNPVIGEFSKSTVFTVNCIEKSKIKKKRPRMANSYRSNVFFKMGHPRPLFRLFSDFFKQTNIKFTIN